MTGGHAHRPPVQGPECGTMQPMMTHRPAFAVGLLLAVALAGCRAPVAAEPSEPLPVTSAAEFSRILAGSSRPSVVNVWASWCLPCRSEAPLLVAAHDRFGDRVRFIGVDVQDAQEAAAAFVAEFGITYENYFDRDRTVPGLLGGVGVPITYFVAPGGEVLSRHNGVIDERTLALNIDELLRR